MNKVRAIVTGSIIWILGASVYTVSYFLPFLEDPDLQASLLLAVAMIPIVWFGSHQYFSKGSAMHGVKFAAIALLTGMLLDAIITVPFLILPSGGSYRSFFGAPAFWLLALEYFLIAVAYWHFMINKPNKVTR